MGCLEPNWTVILAKVDGHWSKLTVIRQKVGGPDELKDKSVRSKTTKAESLETLKGY